MKTIINKINSNFGEEDNVYTISSDALETRILCYVDICDLYLEKLMGAFNPLFTEPKNNKQVLKMKIICDDHLFAMSLNRLNDDCMITTPKVDMFNYATSSSSLARCTGDKRYYIMRCYEYFVYIFDKVLQECYIIIKKNEKALSMVNILLLTPYLLTGELFVIHGGLVNLGERNILISNSSLGGKTTLAILFASQGWNIITEENTYITRSGKLLPINIRNYFNIRIGTYLAFKEFFLSKGIVISSFLEKEHLSNDILFEFGKENQCSVYFDKLGDVNSIMSEYITDFIKVSIDKNMLFSIAKENYSIISDAFLHMSVAPTVGLFEELLGIEKTNIYAEREILNNIFNDVNAISLTTGFDYNEHYNELLRALNIIE